MTRSLSLAWPILPLPLGTKPCTKLFEHSLMANFPTLVTKRELELLPPKLTAKSGTTSFLLIDASVHLRVENQSQKEANRAWRERSVR